MSSVRSESILYVICDTRSRAPASVSRSSLRRVGQLVVAARRLRARAAASSPAAPRLRERADPTPRSAIARRRGSPSPCAPTRSACRGRTRTSRRRLRSDAPDCAPRKSARWCASASRAHRPAPSRDGALRPTRSCRSRSACSAISRRRLRSPRATSSACALLVEERLLLRAFALQLRDLRLRVVAALHQIAEVRFGLLHERAEALDVAGERRHSPRAHATRATTCRSATCGSRPAPLRRSRVARPAPTRSPAPRRRLRPPPTAPPARATMRPLYSARFAVESCSLSSLCRRALPACRLSEFRLRVTSASVSSMRSRFCCVSSSFISAARRFVLYFVMPAASSIRRRRSCGLLERIRSILPCSITE